VLLIHGDDDRHIAKRFHGTLASATSHVTTALPLLGGAGRDSIVILCYGNQQSFGTTIMKTIRQLTLTVITAFFVDRRGYHCSTASSGRFESDGHF